MRIFGNLLWLGIPAAVVFFEFLWRLKPAPSGTGPGGFTTFAVTVIFFAALVLNIRWMQHCSMRVHIGSDRIEIFGAFTTVTFPLGDVKGRVSPAENCMWLTAPAPQRIRLPLAALSDAERDRLTACMEPLPAPEPAPLRTGLLVPAVGAVVLSAVPAGVLSGLFFVYVSGHLPAAVLFFAGIVLGNALWAFAAASCRLRSAGGENRSW